MKYLRYPRAADDRQRKRAGPWLPGALGAEAEARDYSSTVKASGGLPTACEDCLMKPIICRIATQSSQALWNDIPDMPADLKSVAA